MNLDVLSRSWTLNRRLFIIFIQGGWFVMEWPSWLTIRTNKVNLSVEFREELFNFCFCWIVLHQPANTSYQAWLSCSTATDHNLLRIQWSNNLYLKIMRKMQNWCKFWWNIVWRLTVASAFQNDQTWHYVQIFRMSFIERYSKQFRQRTRAVKISGIQLLIRRPRDIACWKREAKREKGILVNFRVKPCRRHEGVEWSFNSAP